MLSTIRGSFLLLSFRQRFAVALLAIGTLLLNSLDIVAISLLGLVGAVAFGESLPGYLNFLGDFEVSEVVMALLMIAAAIFAIKTVSGIFLAKVRQFFLAKLEVYFSNVIAHDIFSRDLTHVKRHSRPHLEWSILRSTSLAFGTVLGASLSLFAELSLTLFILALFFYTDWLSALLVVVYFSIVLTLFQITTYKRISRTGSDFVEGSLSVGQAISDTLEAFREITVHSRVPFFLDRISSARRQTAFGNALQSYMQQVPRLIVEVALILGAIGFAAFQFSITQGAPDFAVVSIFIVGSLRMMSSLLPLYRSYMQLRYLGPQARDSQELVGDSRRRDLRPQSNEVASDKMGEQVAQSLHRSGLSISVEDVSFSYTDGGHAETIIKDLSMSVEPGSTVAIIGPSGAGKSTLVDLILGLHEPTSGLILCSGLRPRVLRNLSPGIISYVPQKPGLISGTVLENIALGVAPSEVNLAAVWEAARMAQIDSLIESLPDELLSRLGKQSNSLSGGQLQRIGLARALYTRPSLLVLDEATSALDAETEASISESLDKLRGRTTTVIVAHRLSTVQHADQVFVIDKGRLVASGKLKDLEQSVPLVKKYIDLMSLDS